MGGSLRRRIALDELALVAVEAMSVSGLATDTDRYH
jgi:hypothetical protein